MLTSTLDLFTLLDLIVNAARDLTRTEATSILLLDNKTGDLYFEAVTGSKSEEIKRIGRAAGQPGRLGGARRPRRRSSTMSRAISGSLPSPMTSTGFQTRSMIAVPHESEGQNHRRAGSHQSGG